MIRGTPRSVPKATGLFRGLDMNSVDTKKVMGELTHEGSVQSATVYPVPFQKYEDGYYQDAVRTGCDALLWSKLGDQKYKITDNFSDHTQRGALLSAKQLERPCVFERCQDQLAGFQMDEEAKFPGNRKPEDGLYGCLKEYPANATRECDSLLWSTMSNMKYSVGGLVPEGRWRLAEPAADGELWVDDENLQFRLQRNRERDMQQAELSQRMQRDREENNSLALRWRIERDQAFLNRELALQDAVAQTAQKNTVTRHSLQQQQEARTAQEIEQNVETGRFIQTGAELTRNHALAQANLRAGLGEAQTEAEIRVQRLQNDLNGLISKQQNTYDRSYQLQLEQERLMRTNKDNGLNVGMFMTSGLAMDPYSDSSKAFASCQSTDFRSQAVQLENAFQNRMKMLA